MIVFDVLGALIVVAALTVWVWALVKPTVVGASATEPGAAQVEQGKAAELPSPGSGRLVQAAKSPE